MTVDEILALGLAKAHLKAAQIATSTQVQYLNELHLDAYLSIVQNVGEDFFYDIWTADAVASQLNGEYAFPTANATTVGMAKLKQLDVLIPSTDDYYRKARQIDLRSLERPWDWYLLNQSAADPIYYVADESFFLAPNFTTDTVGAPGNKQLKLHGIRRAIDLVSGGAESTILIPREFHASVLASGLKYLFMSHVGKDIPTRITLRSPAATAQQEYENAKQEMLSLLTDRDISLGTASVPDDTLLQ